MATFGKNWVKDSKDDFESISAMTHWREREDQEEKKNGASASELEVKIRELLKGIDKDECNDIEGWWETSGGAEFGKEKLEELIRLVNSFIGL